MQSHDEKQERRAAGAAANQAAPPPAPGFRLVRYFTVASLAVFLAVAAALVYFERREGEFLKQVQQAQLLFFRQVQEDFARQQDETARRDLLTVHEAGIVNLTRLFANALWEKDFAPFVARAQRIPVDQCRAIADVKETGGKSAQPGEKQACYAGIGKQIMALPEFRALDAKVFDMMKKSTVFKIKVYDLRGITAYSSEHGQIGEDKIGNAGWQSAMAGKPASQLTHRHKFSAFEGEVMNRDLIESYVPVLAPDGKKIVAVFEVYSDVTLFLEQIRNASSQIQKLSAGNLAQVERAAAATQARVDAGANRLLAIVLGLLALFYLALFLIVRNGQRIIDRQVVERNQANQALTRLNRTLSVLFGINSAIVRIRDRQKLFEEVCRIAVEHGNFGMAWVSEFDPVTLDVTPVAYGGTDTGEFVSSKTTARADLPLGQGVVGRAIRAKDLAVVNDLAAEPDVGSAKRREAIRRGFRSVIALPLLVEGAVFGTLTLYAKETGFFNEEEIKLLTELAGDISFALENIATQDKIKKLARIRAVSGGINAAIIRVRERQALFEETCRIASEHGRFEMVWIGTIDSAKQEVRAVAWTGFSDGAARAVSWTSISAAQGTLGEAIRTRKTAVRNNIEIDLRGGELKREALERGCRSAACLPLVVDGKVVALIALFAAGTRFFDKDEIALLDEMAADLSFALEHIAKGERLDYLAYYDALTGLPNRALFLDRTNQRLRARGSEQRMVALILLDIERLRNVNETFGRQAGDDLLRQVAARLRGAIEQTDVLAHVGGDHFAIATRRTEQGDDIVHILEQTLTRVLGQPLEVGGNQLRLAVRTGIAVYPMDGADAESLLKNAEAALEDAKRKGDRYQFYAPEMNARVAEQLKLENELRDAVSREQYVLHYQPRLDLSSGRIVGLEALIRWRHPDRGMVSPADFIPVLEETGMILEVGRWALTRAALDHAAWCAAGLRPPRIAVNVSPAQLRRRDFVDHVKEALVAVDKAAERIDIEITEGMLMEDVEDSIKKLKAVQSLGLNVAVDDFGTGYSSLSYLARLPINSLKIDRSFIIQINKGPEQMAIVSTVISLARALNLKVVAEGVETEEQANLLRLLRCDEAQGYLFSRPVPPDQVEALLARQ